ncbi:DMT family transporter [Cohaesibacter gelatinilyticus]|uniref:EamA-like transporter family protein n=1 Tax=Cohaesibacter gelatinilyticus TaxID=372072 RepID=A0A285PIP3_9HYPH|nr:DMT family transporter [Cohaesibacter gelatinilyticus]SNZ21599.1 EamA-like transporter family protein [Cohaesibacter gelatinilyticus]
MDNLKGSLFMVLAMFAFTLEDSLIKAIAARLPVGEILILFGAGGMLIFALTAFVKSEPVLSKAMMSKTMIIRSVFEISGRLFYTIAIALSPLSSASAILQATPLVVAAGAVLVFHEKVGWRRWLAIFIGFGGVVMILRPGAGDFELMSIFALLGVIGFAGRDLATRAAPPHLTNAQLGILGFLMLVIAGIIATLYTKTWIAPDWGETGYLIAAIVIGVLAYNALTMAMRMGEIGVVAPFRYTRLVFAMIIGVWFFNEAPDQWTLLGSAIIVISGLYTLVRGNK